MIIKIAQVLKLWVEFDMIHPKLCSFKDLFSLFKFKSKFIVRLSHCKLTGTLPAQQQGADF